jgi:hypothetical protein
MNDGIYRVDFQSEKDAGKGIARVSNGDFRGIDQTHVYFGKVEGQGASLTMLMYAPATTGAPAGSDMQAPFSMNGAPVRLNVQKTENGFDLSGVSDAHSETRYEFKAERVADLLAD